MPEEPLSVGEILAGEYRALRPDSDIAGAEPAELYRQVHGDPQPLSALCISGGGIRSATFALGAIQGLAEHGLLEQFDYLSTVSGGGFIGSWLSAWVNRAGGLAKVVPQLRRDAPPAAPGTPDPVRHLREYNSYLSPRVGALSGDVWTLAAIVLRNILLNWLVLIPLLMFALMLPRIGMALLSFPELIYSRAVFRGPLPPDYRAPALNAVSGSPWVQFVLPGLSAFLFAMALFNTMRYLPAMGNRDHSRGDYLSKVLAPLMGAVFTFLMFDSLYFLGSKFSDYSNLSSVIGWTVLPAAAAWLAYLIFYGGSFRRALRLLFGPMSLAIASMAASTGFATWAATNFLLSSPHPHPGSQISWGMYVTLGPPAILLGYCLGTTVFIGLSSNFLKDEDREWMSRAVAGVLLAAVAWLGQCVVVLLAPRWALGWRTWAQGSFGAVGAICAWLSASGRAPAPGAGGERAGSGSKLKGAAQSLAVKLAPLLFLVVLGVGLTILSNLLLAELHSLSGIGFAGGEAIGWKDHNAMLDRSSPGLRVLLAGILLALGWITAHFVNINTFSLHGMYRDRLIRAYLGASNAARRASRFTGFARDDDFPIHRLDPRLRPLHVVNLTLNLVATTRLDWQQRKAQAFTVTPLHCGNCDLGYRPAAEYGGADGITLGTAVAISGAAASPSMGYHSSPVVGFIMTLFNARLGAWLGNPGPAGKDTWRDPGPRSAIRSLVREAFGLTSNESAYVYLSDGGHFENLGLYEMVRRRCRSIVVLDGGADPGFAFDDLGNALRKIQIDLRIPIDFHGEVVRPLRARRSRCATAVIRYSAVDGPCEDGRLIYIKPVRLGDEPPDVDSYATANPDFPHQTTADQWFNESQTESYRRLGRFTVDEICRAWRGGQLADWPGHVESFYLAGEGQRTAD
ncbi:MAG TPA: patatin-like phospholipase family protein [Thermoanaerobaculia bacterium]|nr:patatin-like phospholipase family protein [Thermoanaerobaculia bacterium]